MGKTSSQDNIDKTNSTTNVHRTISAIKHKHLQEIKETIPKEAHYFYYNLDNHGE